MSKNLTLKGLALGAIVALGSTVIAGTPALAIDPVSLEPTTGTQYTTIAGETFSLTSLFTDAAQVAAEELKFEIVDSSDKLDIAAANGTDLAGATRNATTHKIVIDNNITAFSGDVLTLKAAATTDAFDVTVQAWLDYDGDNVVDSGESASAVRTVKFIKAADAGVVTTLSSLVFGTTAVKATVGFNSAVNVAQLNAGNYSVAFGKLNAGVASGATSGSTFSSGAATVGEALTYDSTNNVLATASTVVLSANAEAAIYEAVAVKGGAEYGSAVFKTVVAGVVNATPTAFAATTGDNISGSANAYSVRTGTKTVSVSSAITKADGDDAGTDADVAAGVTGTVTVEYVAATSDTTTTITVGGKTLSATKTSDTFDATSNADGKFVFDVVSSSGAKDSVVKVKVKVSGTSAPVENAFTVFTWADATVSTVTDLVVGSNHRAVVKGATVSVDYLLTDNFGAVVTAEGYRVHATAPAAALDGTSVVTLNKYVPFVAGKATVSYTAAVAGTFSLAATVQKQGTDGNYSGSYGTTSSNINVLAAAQAAKTITASASLTTGVVLETKTFVAGDDRVLGNAFTPAYTSANAVTVTGDVTDEYGAAVYGAPVTISGAGLFFKSGDVYAIGSITVQSNNSGRYTVEVFGNKAGKVTVTATSGAATKTVDITFAGGSRANIVAAGTTVVVPTASQAGRSVDLTATIVDKFGNPVSGVDVTFAVTGVGTLSDADGVVATNDKGVATVKLTAQYAEFGDATVTVTHAGADATSTVTSDDFSVVKNVAFGVTDASIDLLGKRVIVTSEFAKGKKVTVYDNGVRKYSAIQTSDAERIIAWNVKKGSHNIVVKISGGYSDNLVLTVK